MYIPHHIAKTTIFEYCQTAGLKISGNLELESLSVSQASVHSVKPVSQEGSSNIREAIDSQDVDEALPENRTEPVNPSVPTRPEMEQNNISSTSIPLSLYPRNIICSSPSGFSHIKRLFSASNGARHKFHQPHG